VPLPPPQQPTVTRTNLPAQGMREMACRGYNVILLRDGTTGIELTAGLGHPVRPTLSMTQAAILNLELKVGHSSTCGDLVTALREADVGGAKPRL
jgi:hypothetical protein